jgi:sporulation protein YlmC with PRC-barrel domain
VAVSEIKGKDIYNLRGEDLGEVERVILGSGNQAFGVVRFGEFLGLGGEARLLPLSRMALQEDRIVIPNMTEAELRALPAYRQGMAGYREAEPNYQARLASNIATDDRAQDRAGMAANERTAERRDAQARMTAEEPVDTGAVDAAADMRPFQIADLEDMDVYSLRGQKVGEVKRVIRSLGDNRGYVVLEHGGFLGLGEKEVPLPINRMFVMNDRLVVAGMTEAEVNAIPDWDFNTDEYREYRDNETVEIRLRE